MRVHSAPFALALLLAGCLGAAPADPPGPGDPSVPAGDGVWWHFPGQEPAPAAGPAAEGVQRFHGLPAPEPTLGVHPSGAIFTTASVPNPSCAGCPAVPYANFRAGPTALRTADGGATFEDVFPKLPTGDSYKLRTWDPYLWVDPDTGRVFLDDIYPIGCGFLSFSDDQGATWTHNPLACGNPNANDHQTLVTAKPRALATVGYPNVVHRCTNNLVQTGCAVSLNGGLTFLPQRPIPRLDGCGAITGHLAADAEGRVFLPGLCGDAPAVTLTEDDGLTWTTHTIDAAHPADDHDVDVAADAAGHLYAVWPSDGQLFLSRSADHGRTWSPGRNVTAPGVTATYYQAVTAGAAGRVAFAYVGTTVPGGYDGKATPPGLISPTDLNETRRTLDALLADEVDDPSWANATWHAYLGVIEDASAERPLIQTVRLSPAADPVARGQCAGTRCFGMADFIDIAVDPAGRPWASLVDVCNAACAPDPKAHHDKPVGYLGTLRVGPSLRGGALAPLT